MQDKLFAASPVSEKKAYTWKKYRVFFTAGHRATTDKQRTFKVQLHRYRFIVRLHATGNLFVTVGKAP